MNEIIHGDCLEELRKFPDNHFDSVVTDPPYALNFMGKEWDNFAGYVERNGSSRAVGDDGGRHDEGYRNMRGKEQDFQSWCQLWASECLRVLKPGGHLLAFGGTRTYHRLACGIEDAGFEIRDSLHWIYGSGFPKSMDVSKAIDKAAGVSREVVGTRGDGSAGSSSGVLNMNGRDVDHGSARDSRIVEITAPATEAAARWDGWGTALKPAHEPIVLARKPLTAKTVAANVLAYGTGGLNIDGCRVGWDEKSLVQDTLRRAKPRADVTGGRFASGAGADMKGYQGDSESPPGRWPPNILLSEDAAAEMDQQTGTLTSGSGAFKKRSSADFEGNVGSAYGAESRPAGTEMISYGDSGGASRFFPCFRYQAKASPKERPKVWKSDCNCETIKPCQSRAKDITDSVSDDDRSWNTSGSGSKQTNDPFLPDMTSITETTISSTTTSQTYSSSPNLNINEFIQDVNSGMESGGNPVRTAKNSSLSSKLTGISPLKAGPCMDDVVPATSGWSYSPRSCDVCGKSWKSESHATVKPVDLMRWLVRLVTPPGGIVLDPFSGSGTTAEACILEGFWYVLIEREADYIKLIHSRLKKHLDQPVLFELEEL